MKKLVLLITAVLTLSGMFASSASALSFTVAIGDQGYYTHGAGYWSSGVYYIWVPGHWRVKNNHKVWVHGHYRVK